jgi:Uma2 family endonuclease
MAVGSAWPAEGPRRITVDEFEAMHRARRWHIHVPNPVRLDPYNEPQPDVTVLRFRRDFSSPRQAGADDFQLLVEVAESSLGADRTEKRQVYARTAIRRYWVVDLNHELIHVC